MKYFILILILIPSLCFAQFGVNTSNPKAELHLAKTKNLPTLIIENMPNKNYDEKESYEKLIIDKNGIVKKTMIEKIEGSGQESQRFYLKEDFVYPNRYKNPLSLKFINFKNNEMTNGQGQIIIREKGTYALMLTFSGNSNKPTDDENKNKTLGQFYITIVDASNNNAIFDTAETTWLLSDHTSRFSSSTMFIINNDKDENLSIEIQLSKDMISTYKLTLDAPLNENDTGKKTNVTMWKL